MHLRTKRQLNLFFLARANAFGVSRTPSLLLIDFDHFHQAAAEHVKASRASRGFHVMAVLFAKRDDMASTLAIPRGNVHPVFGAQ